MKLVEILLDRGFISPEQLRSIAGYQNLDNEHLSTCLFEHGLLTGDELATALGVLFGVPPALDRDFANADASLRKRLNSHQAAKFKSIPLYGTPVRRAAVAMVNPAHPGIVEELGFVLGAAIEPMVTSEPVLARQLEAFYSMPRRRTTGFHPVASQANGGASAARNLMLDEDSHPINLLPLAINADSQFQAVTATPRPPTRPSLPYRARHETKSYLAAVSDIPLFVPVDPGAPLHAAEDALAQTPIPPMVAVTGPDPAVDLIVSASDRQAAADHLFAFMRSCFGAGAMFAINGVLAEGRFGYNEGVACPGVESLVFSLSLPSCLRSALGQRTVVYGSPSPEGDAVHRALWSALGCAPPREVLAAAVVAADRPAILLYAHGRRGGRIEKPTAARLEKVCAALGNTLVRLAG
jgi:hypothetical protein